MKLHRTYFSYRKWTNLNRAANPTYGGGVCDAWGVFDGLILRAATVVKAGGLIWVEIPFFLLFLLFTLAAPKIQRWKLIPPHWCQIVPNMPQVEGSVVRGDEKWYRRAEDIVICLNIGENIRDFEGT